MSKKNSIVENKLEKIPQQNYQKSTNNLFVI